MWTVASSTSRPFARCAIAEAKTTTTASIQARCLRRASPRESQIVPSPSAITSVRAADGTPGGSTPWTRRRRSAASGVSPETIETTTGDRREPGEQRGRRRTAHEKHRVARPAAAGIALSRAGGRGGARPRCPDWRIASTWSPASRCVSLPAISALPSRTTEISLAPFGSRSAWTSLPSQAAPLSTVTSTISRFSLRSSSRWIRPCSGTSCSIRAMIAPVAEMVGEIPSRSKYDWLRGSLMRAITFDDAVALAGELADDDVVLVVAGRGDEQVRRPLDAGALEHVQLGRVAAEHLVLELDLELVEAVRVLLDQRHLVAGAEQRTGEVRADLAAACDQDVHLGGHLSGAHGGDERVDRRRGRADDVQAALGVELGAAPDRARGRSRWAPRTA